MPKKMMYLYFKLYLSFVCKLLEVKLKCEEYFKEVCNLKKIFSWFSHSHAMNLQMTCTRHTS